MYLKWLLLVVSCITCVKFMAKNLVRSCWKELSQESESGSTAATLIQPQDSAANIRDALMSHFTN